MDADYLRAPKAQPVPWYRQRSLQLILATLVFFAPLLALPIAWSQAAISRPLALRGQPVLRVQALPSGAVTVLYAQTAGNLWRSLDDGVTWTRADGGLPAGGLGASRVVHWAAAPSAAWTLTALVGQDDVVRLYQSSDGGDTWRAGGRWLVAAGVSEGDAADSYALALCAADAQQVYVAVAQQLWHSGDGGRSWSAAVALPAAVSGGGPLLLAVDGQEPAVLYVSRGSGVWRSLDQGQSWAPAGDLPPLAEISSLTTAQERSGLIFAGGRAVVFHSADQGVTWKAAELPGALGLTRALLVDPKVGETVFALDEHGQLFRSDDAGSQWQMISSTTGQPWATLALNPVRRNHLYSAGADGIWYQPVELLQPTPTPTATATPTHTPTATATATPTATPTATATATPTATATATATPSPTSSPTATRTPAPATATATATPRTTTVAPVAPEQPTATPAPAGGGNNAPPTAVPTAAPTSAPTIPPTPPPR